MSSWSQKGPWTPDVSENKENALINDNSHNNDISTIANGKDVCEIIPDAMNMDTNYKIVRFSHLSVYVGQVNEKNQPHGNGYHNFNDGSQHQGEFWNGTAHGAGVFVTAAGFEYEGNWIYNQRNGIFQILNNKGERWVEKYKDGKKVSRKKKKVMLPNPKFTDDNCDEPRTIEEPVPLEDAGRECWNCGGYYRDNFNNPYACRRHAGYWNEDPSYRGEGLRPGVWSCCTRQEKDECGCSFSDHNLRG